jgi:TATA-binding protein-associated factor Taf7
MTNVMGKIMAEVLCLLAIATKEMKQKRTSAFISGTELPLAYIRTETFFKKLIGRNEIEDALQKLDKLEQGELRTVTSQVLKTTCDIRDVANDLKGATSDLRDATSDIKDGARLVRLIDLPY